MPTTLTQYLKTHVFYIVIIALLAIGFRSWLEEHDARLQADTLVKVSQAKVETLQSQIKIEQDAAAKTIAALQRQRIEVKTPAQAIAAIPDLSTIPLGIRQLPDDPARISVEAIPLFQQLNSCKQDAVARAVCESTSAKKDEVIAEKDSQIKALTAKPKFWKRVWGHVKDQGIGIAIGLGIREVLK